MAYHHFPCPLGLHPVGKMLMAKSKVTDLNGQIKGTYAPVFFLHDDFMMTLAFIGFIGLGRFPLWKWMFRRAFGVEVWIFTFTRVIIKGNHQEIITGLSTAPWCPFFGAPMWNQGTMSTSTIKKFLVVSQPMENMPKVRETTKWMSREWWLKNFEKSKLEFIFSIIFSIIPNRMKSHKRLWNQKKMPAEESSRSRPKDPKMARGSYSETQS